MNSNAVLPTPEVLLRLMVYTGISRHNATPIGPDAWVDFDTATGPTFQYGTEHTLTLLTQNPPEKGKYVVAMIPYMRQIPHPENSEIMVPLVTIYFASKELWPLFDPLTEEDLSPINVAQRESSFWAGFQKSIEG